MFRRHHQASRPGELIGASIGRGMSAYEGTRCSAGSSLAGRNRAYSEGNKRKNKAAASTWIATISPQQQRIINDATKCTEFNAADFVDFADFTDWSESQVYYDMQNGE